MNFAHDKKSWVQMEALERATGRKIKRVATSDLDEMDEVGFVTAIKVLTT